MQTASIGKKLILASQSPRRQYMLRQAGLRICVVPPDIDESSVGHGLEPDRHVRRLARLKACDVARRHPDSFVIGADTIVVIDGEILGKPADAPEARRMLQRLSGKTHQVITGYAVVCEKKKHLHVDAEVTDVTFKSLSEAEIGWYIRSGEPFDKAGAYAIQGIGTFFVKRINGSYSNVVGLPVCELICHLMAIGVVGADMKDLTPIEEPSGLTWI